MVARAAAGARGELRAGYQVAAELGAWTLELATWQPRRYALQAPVVRRDAHWSTYSPLSLTLTMNQRVWRWEGVAPSWNGGTVKVVLDGPPTVLREST